MSRYGSDCKVYVGDLGNNASKQELEDAFGYYGPLRNVWVARNPPGFAFVEFEDPRDAEDAVRGLGEAEFSLFFILVRFRTENSIKNLSIKYAGRLKIFFVIEIKVIFIPDSPRIHSLNGVLRIYVGLSFMSKYCFWFRCSS